MKKTEELFNKWNKEKKKIDFDWNPNKIVKVWEIWIIKIWMNIWWENSKNNDFTRPALVISNNLWWDLIWIIPFTSSFNKNFKKYYFLLENSSKYWLEKESNLLLNQFKVISKKRLIRKIDKDWKDIFFENKEFLKILGIIKNMI